MLRHGSLRIKDRSVKFDGFLGLDTKAKPKDKEGVSALKGIVQRVQPEQKTVFIGDAG